MKLTPPYKYWLKEIKDIVALAKSKAALSVNEHLLLMYWQLGQMIVQKQKQHLWGDAVIEQLSLDLKKAFPYMKGFSRTNLFNCKKLFLFYSGTKVQPVVGQLQNSKNKKIIQVQPVVGQLKLTIPRTLKFITQIPWSHNRNYTV